jgi:hypothetical protein
MAQRIDHPRARRVALRPFFVFLVLACGSSPDRPPPPPSRTDIDLTDLVQYDTMTADARDVYATGTCSDGATRECRVYLPSHNDVQPCFVGQQTCAGSQWGECESGVLVDVNADDAEIDPSDLPD